MTIFRFNLAVCALIVAQGVVPVVAQETAPPPRPVHLSSGLTATLAETIWDDQTNPPETWGRFRFLAPGIAGDAFSFAQVSDDLAQLCREQAVPAIVAAGRKVELVVISLSAEPVAFGETRPDLTQYFEAYTVTDGDCILEGF